MVDCSVAVPAVATGSQSRSGLLRCCSCGPACPARPNSYDPPFDRCEPTAGRPYTSDHSESLWISSSVFWWEDLPLQVIGQVASCLQPYIPWYGLFSGLGVGRSIDFSMCSVYMLRKWRNPRCSRLPPVTDEPTAVLGFRVNQSVEFLVPRWVFPNRIVLSCRSFIGRLIHSSSFSEFVWVFTIYSLKRLKRSSCFDVAEIITHGHRWLATRSRCLGHDSSMLRWGYSNARRVGWFIITLSGDTWLSLTYDLALSSWLFLSWDTCSVINTFSGHGAAGVDGLHSWATSFNQLSNTQSEEFSLCDVQRHSARYFLKVDNMYWTAGRVFWILRLLSWSNNVALGPKSHDRKLCCCVSKSERHTNLLFPHLGTNILRLILEEFSQLIFSHYCLWCSQSTIPWHPWLTNITSWMWFTSGDIWWMGPGFESIPGVFWEASGLLSGIILLSFWLRGVLSDRLILIKSSSLIM